MSSLQSASNSTATSSTSCTQFNGVTASQIRRAIKKNNNAKLQQLLKQALVCGDLPGFANIINCGNENNKNALHIAAQWRKCSTVECLLDHKADINAAASRGQRAICFAIGKRRHGTIQLLLKRGANVLVRSVQGDTPLSLARRQLGTQRPDIVDAIEAQQKSQIALNGKWCDFMNDERAILTQVNHTFNCRNCLDKVRFTLAASSVTRPSPEAPSSHDPARPYTRMTPWISRFLDIHRTWHAREDDESKAASAASQPIAPCVKPLGLNPTMLAVKNVQWWQPGQKDAREAVFRCVVGRVFSAMHAHKKRRDATTMRAQFAGLVAELHAVLVDTGQILLACLSLARLASEPATVSQTICGLEDLAYCKRALRKRSTKLQQTLLKIISACILRAWTVDCSHATAQSLPLRVRTQLAKDVGKARLADPSRHAALAVFLAGCTPHTQQPAAPVAAVAAKKTTRRPEPLSAGVKRGILDALSRWPEEPELLPPSTCAHPQKYHQLHRRDAVVWVDTEDAARAARDTLDRLVVEAQRGTCCPTSGTHHAANADAVVLVGVDTEFGGDGQGCAVVQFATRSHMWVVDVRAAEAATTLALVKWVFENKALQKIGFSFHNDWRELELLMCGIRSSSTPVVDLQALMVAKDPPIAGSESIARRLQGLSGTPGLSSVTEVLLGLPLDKSCQRSDWLERPLSASQLRYAALDAVVLLDITCRVLRS